MLIEHPSLLANCPLCGRQRVIGQGNRVVIGRAGDHSYPAVYVFECKRCCLKVEQKGVCGDLTVAANRHALTKLGKRLKNVVANAHRVR